jgi:hypothetical protein
MPKKNLNSTGCYLELMSSKNNDQFAYGAKTEAPKVEKADIKQPRMKHSQIFLTYSQTTKRMTCEWLLRQINRITGDRVTEYLISQEKHKDEGLHLHAYFKFSKDIDTLNMGYYDLVHYRKNYHPNIRKIKSWWYNAGYGQKKVRTQKDGSVRTVIEAEKKKFSGRYKLFAYIKKDGNYITNIEETRPPLLALIEDVEDEYEFNLQLMYMMKFDISKYGAYDTMRRLRNILRERRFEEEQLKRAAEYLDNRNEAYAQFRLGHQVPNGFPTDHSRDRNRLEDVV